MTRPDFPTPTRIHVALNVKDIDRSISFYQKLFAQPPAKVRPGYAKFEVAEPAVNFSLNQAGRGALSHFGIQVKSSAAVKQQALRLSDSGLTTRGEESTTCCYAVQDKVWVADPDGNEWEFFVVLDDLKEDPEREMAAADASTDACCVESCCPGSRTDVAVHG